MTTQLTNLIEYNPCDIVFGDPIVSSGRFNNKYINISTRNPDGSEGQLIFFATPGLYSPGIQESTNKLTGKIDGYSFPLYLWNRNGATEEQKTWLDKFNALIERCKEHLLENKQTLGKWDMERGDLRKIASCLWWKRDKATGEVMPGTGPSLYAKMMGYNRDTGYSFETMLYDPNGDPLDPLDVVSKRCVVDAAIVLESIFLGTDGKIRLQVKIYEAFVRVLDASRKRLLLRPSLAITGGAEDARAYQDEEDLLNEI